MSNPRFSIVIPTRNRAQTLYHSLRTCLMQQFADFEIVVCDNCSSPETKQVVDSLNSDKIKYFRSDVPLAMSDNWEKALSHTTGEYVIFIGDDDGMLPDALTDLDMFIAKTGAKAIRWAVATYTWSDVEGGLAANKIHIPAPTETSHIDSHQTIQTVMLGEKSYSLLPMLYYSAIHQSLIQDLRDRAGTIFKGSYPDVYTGFAIAYVAKTHYMIGKPLSIVGYSGKSNGIAALMNKKETNIAKEFNKLNEAAGYVAYQSQIPNIPVMTTFTATEFLNAKQALFADDNQLIFDRKQMIINCIRDLESFNRVEADEWNLFTQAIAESLNDDKNLHDWFEATFIQNYQPKGQDWVFSEKAWQDGLTSNSLFMDGKAFDISDVYAAAQLCGKIIGTSSSFINVTNTKSLHEQLVEKERVIQQFHQELLAKEQIIKSFRHSLFFGLTHGPIFQIPAKVGRFLKSLLQARS